MEAKNSTDSIEWAPASVAMPDPDGQITELTVEMEIKPGWQTTEFWLTVGVTIATAVRTLGPLFGLTETEELAQSTEGTFEGVGLAVVNAAAIYAYIQSRVAVKTGNG